MRYLDRMPPPPPPVPPPNPSEAWAAAAAKRSETLAQYLRDYQLGVGPDGMASGVYFKGGTLVRASHALAVGGTVEQCYRACELHPGCEQFTWEAPRGLRGGAQCLLKSSDSAPARAPRRWKSLFTSGIVSTGVNAGGRNVSVGWPPALLAAQGQAAPCPSHPIGAAVRMALKRWPALSPTVRVCEINHDDAFLPSVLLCEAGRSSNYLGISFKSTAQTSSGRAKQEALPDEQPPCPPGRCTLLSSPYARTVQHPSGMQRGRPRVGECDIIVANMDDTEAKWRQALVYANLANVLRLATDSAVVVVHGGACDASAKFKSAWAPGALPVWCWQDRVWELANTSGLSDARCPQDARSARRFCTGKAPTAQISACASRPALLSRAEISMAREIRVHPLIGHAFRRQVRYFTALPCLLRSRTYDERVAFRAHNGTHKGMFTEASAWEELSAPLRTHVPERRARAHAYGRVFGLQERHLGKVRGSDCVPGRASFQ